MFSFLSVLRKEKSLILVSETGSQFIARGCREGEGEGGRKGGRGERETVGGVGGLWLKGENHFQCDSDLG